MKKENKHRKRIPQPFAGGNPFSHSFFLKIGEEEDGIKLCYPVISRQIQGRRYRKTNWILPKREDSFMMKDIFCA